MDSCRCYCGGRRFYRLHTQLIYLLFLKKGDGSHRAALIPYLGEQVHCFACCHSIGIDTQLSFGDSATVSVEILYPSWVKCSRRSIFECHYIRRKSVTLTCCHKHLVNQLGAIHRRVVPIEGIVVRLV